MSPPTGFPTARPTPFPTYSSSDYNGFRPNPGKAESFQWNSPAAGVAADYTAYPPVRRYRTFEEYRGGAGQDRHSILLDYDVFVRVAQPDVRDPQRVYRPESFVFRLRDGASAVDAGTYLPTITDGYAGTAPDLGALESGRPPFGFGPR
jgi:hypothetical protein